MIVNSLEELEKAPPADAYLMYLHGRFMCVQSRLPNVKAAFRSRKNPKLLTVRLVNFVQSPAPCGHPVIEDEADYRRCPDCGKEWPV